MEGYIKFTVSEVDPETTRIDTDCELRHVNMENKGQLLVSLADALEISNGELLAHVLAIRTGILKREYVPKEADETETDTTPETKEEQ